MVRGFSRARAADDSTHSRTRAARSTDSRLSSSLPASIREMSSTVLMSWSRWVALPCRERT
jgi:hypothetical protein